MNYLIIIGLICLSCFFALLSYYSKGNIMIRTATAFLFFTTGILILSNGIEVPAGTLTTLIR